MKVRIKDYYKMILGFITFFMSGQLFVIGYSLITGKSLDLTDNVVYARLDLIVSVLVMAVLVFLYRKVLLDDFKKIKTQYKSFFKLLLKVLLAFGIFFAIKLGVGIIESVIMLITKTPAQEVANQSVINDLLGASPISMIIAACIIAPISEEVLYRGGIRQIIKNKKVFVPVSGLIFGFMHVTDCHTFLLEILLLGVVVDLIVRSNMKKGWKVIVSLVALSAILLIYYGAYYYMYGNVIDFMKTFDKVEVIGSLSYVTMGCVFAFFYAKEDNIWHNILLHAYNNIFGIAMLLLFYM